MLSEAIESLLREKIDAYLKSGGYRPPRFGQRIAAKSLAVGMIQPYKLGPAIAEEIDSVSNGIFESIRDVLDKVSISPYSELKDDLLKLFDSEFDPLADSIRKVGEDYLRQASSNPPAASRSLDEKIQAAKSARHTDLKIMAAVIMQQSEDESKPEDSHQHRRFHPIFAALAAFLLAIGYALATNPSHSVAAAWVFVIAAVLGIYSVPLRTTISVVGIIVALAIGVWLTLDALRPEHPPTNSQHPLTTSKSRFSEKKDHFAVTVGGITMGFDAKQSPKSLLGMDGVDVVTGEIVDGKLVVDAQLFNAQIKLIGDELSGRPPTWDSNFDDTALEIVDDTGEPMFQIEYVNDQLAVLYGFFSAGTGPAILFAHKEGTDGIPATWDAVRQHRLDPIFKYPSARHRGERVNP